MRFATLVSLTFALAAFSLPLAADPSDLTHGATGHLSGAGDLTNKVADVSGMGVGHGAVHSRDTDLPPVKAGGHAGGHVKGVTGAGGAGNVGARSESKGVEGGAGGAASGAVKPVGAAAGGKAMGGVDRRSDSKSPVDGVKEKVWDAVSGVKKVAHA